MNAAEDERGAAYALLLEEHDRGDTPRKLLQYRCQHQRAIARRLSGDQQEHDLPRKRDADEAVEVFRMRDGRRIVVSDALFHEVQRRDHDESVDRGDAEYPASNFHGMP